MTMIARLINYIIILCLVSIIVISLDSIIDKPDKANIQLKKVIETVNYELFKRGINVQNNSVIIGFGNPALEGSVGVFYYGFDGKSYIKILRKYFDAAPDEVREALILHEIAHSYGLNHDNSWAIRSYVHIYQSCPKSVMHPSHNMQHCFYNNRKYYYDEVSKNILTHNNK